MLQAKGTSTDTTSVKSTDQKFTLSTTLACMLLDTDTYALAHTHIKCRNTVPPVHNLSATHSKGGPNPSGSTREKAFYHFPSEAVFNMQKLH